MKTTRVITGLSADSLPIQRLIDEGEPAILKGVAADWPLVRKGLEGARAAIDYLASFDAGQPVVGYTGAPEIGGRFFYNDDLTRLNFEAKRVSFREFLNRIAEHLDDRDAPSFYIGSTDLSLFLPGLGGDNGLPADLAPLANHKPMAGIWIGNRTVASTHYDFSNNIACSLVGRRRFTLFPPDQIANLYPGPLEPTPGGQVVSMVDLRAPDFDRFPAFREALEHAQVAELEPGDLLIYPAMWWHNVEALDAFNVMINYWWNAVPRFVDTPMITLKHALLSLRDRPEHEKAAWRELFDYYVFGDAQQATSHLPEHVQGPLGRMDDIRARRLRADILARLNR
ncbi:cupin-like domain-containing protein [Sphingomonas sp. SM33]|uniref:Cupin-like domain-containing protein n=1 Tax=Sphingomonas telluris TaxID=2907998 RepID=A0ABS9VNF2_9SPHN|nr:cupin-like domain-containing protein [Sphingomonas telluris]MCH8616044.1 cupin-like domain-containing protein [Sphingomonas telluris]